MVYQQLRSCCRVWDVAHKITGFLVRADIPELEAPSADSNGLK